MLAAAVLSLLLCSPKSSAQPNTQGHVVETEEDELARRVADSLRSDPERRQILAQRILRSSLAESLSSPNGDPQVALSGISDWIRDHPEDAAHLSIGFAKDDYYQNHEFEDSLRYRIKRYFELNPERDKGILGALKAVGSESKTLRVLGDKLAEEEQREILKRMFEGRGLENDTVLTHPSDHAGNPSDGAAGAHEPGGSAVFAAAGIYDRLNMANPTGYSPDVVTYQSALNARRPPGAPPLLANGRLDFPTLVYPSYSLRFDLERLHAELDRERAQASPQAAHKRESLLASAADSIAQFQQEAAKAKEKAKITPSLLRALGRHQREAARWLTSASLQAELDRTTPLADFMTEALRREIERAPVPDEIRRAYLAEGDKLKGRTTRLLELDSRALADLEGEQYLSRWDDAAKSLSQASPLRRRLADDISLYTTTPFSLNAAYRPKPRWRVWIERLILWLAPNSTYGRHITAERQRVAALAGTFLRIASGRTN